MSSLWSELTSFARFLTGLSPILRRKVSYQAAREIILGRLQRREANFLDRMEHNVFANPRSPYRRLLDHAGCDLADVRELVSKQGLEGALRTLRDAGVYLSFEEFKGIQPVVRGSVHFTARSEDFDNPTFGRYYTMTTGGSTGTGRRVLMDLDHLAARIPISVVLERIEGTAGLPALNWYDIPPGHGLNSVLQSIPGDNIPRKWYTPIRGGSDGTSRRFRFATQAALTVARLGGARVPSPEFLPLDQAAVVARWARDQLAAHGRCVVRGQVSRILRVAIAAQQEGIDLTGAILVGGSEPPTAAKVARIKSTGATFRSSYYFVEVGPVGWSCTTSDEPNDQHFFKDHLAMFQAPREVPGFEVTVGAFYYTTLLPTAPKLLFNVESDDYGVFEQRRCGCPWETEFGFTDHIRDIRSFKKLSGEGVTLVGTDMERILEEVLPARFGGSPLDYQLLEEEDEQGFTRLDLLVSPQLVVDETEVSRAFLDALHGSGAAGDLSRAIWQQAQTLRVRREPPRLTKHGKLMPLQLRRPGVQPGTSR
ncbi:MAG: hypothetical protein ACKVZ0_20860 [Gemmatimonadales bacterium]